MFSSIRQFFLNWSLPSLLNKTKGQGSVEVSCPWRGACARKGGRGHCPCKAGNKNCNANCQCHWHSRNEVTKLKIIKHPAVQYFSIFLFKIQKKFNTKMFFLYLQSSSASRQPTIWNLMFFANPVYRVQSHPNTWHLKAFQCHGRTQSSNNSYFSLNYTNFSLENILPSFTILKCF